MPWSMSSQKSTVTESKNQAGAGVPGGAVLYRACRKVHPADSGSDFNLGDTSWSLPEVVQRTWSKTLVCLNGSGDLSISCEPGHPREIGAFLFNIPPYSPPPQITVCKDSNSAFQTRPAPFSSILEGLTAQSPTAVRMHSKHGAISMRIKSTLKRGMQMVEDGCSMSYSV